MIPLLLGSARKMRLASFAEAAKAGSPQLQGGRRLAAEGNMEDQRNVPARSGWFLAVFSVILITMAMQFVSYRAAVASFGLEFSFVSLME